MVLFGLSILIASISFIYYRHFYQSWPSLQWLNRAHGTSDPHTQNRDITSVSQQTEDDKLILKEDITLKKMDDENSQEPSEREEILITERISDSKAMPPPPLPLKKSNLLPSSNVYYNTESTISTRTSNSTIHSEGQENQTESNSSAPIMPLRVQKLPGKTSPFVLKPPSMSSLSPLPNRKPDGLASTTQKSAARAKSNKKVILKPGHSPLDWARLSSSSANLSGLPSGASYIKVPPSLLKTYTGRKGKDAWTVLGNKVYNITPYLPFHPGGEHELLRCAGKDGTKLFTDVHPWVNWEGMLAACLVGITVEEHETYTRSDLHEID